MTTPRLRGLAVLALLCLLPRASATVTYLTDNRMMSVTGSYAGSTTNQSAAPSAAFADFSQALNAIGGLQINQSSQIRPDSLQSSGSFSALIFPGTSANVTAQSLFDVSFSVDSYTAFNLTGYRDLPLFGVNDFRLTGPGNSTIVFWTGNTGGLQPNAREASGILAPGTYRMAVDLRAGLNSTGTIMDGTYGRYTMALTLGAAGVPAGEHSAAAYFGSILLILTVVHRRRFLRPEMR